MKSKILLLSVLLSLSGLSSAKSSEVSKEKTNHQLYYQVDVVTSDKVEGILSGAFIGSTKIEHTRKIPYTEKAYKENGTNMVETNFAKNILRLEINPDSVFFLSQDLISLDIVYPDVKDKDVFLQLPSTRKFTYGSYDLNLNELKGCLFIQTKDDSNKNILGQTTDNHFKLKICDTLEGLSS